MAETESEDQPKTTTVSVQRLVRLRGAHRSAASKLVSRIDDFVEKISYVTRSSPEWQGEDLSVNDREDCALDLTKLREKVDLLDRLDSQILDAIEDDDIESEICDAADYLMKYESRIGRATQPFQIQVNCWRISPVYGLPNPHSQSQSHCHPFPERISAAQQARPRAIWTVGNQLQMRLVRTRHLSPRVTRVPV